MRITIEKAVSLLKDHGNVAVPTETVYGLAASLFCPEAIQQIFKLKGRPSSNPLIIHLSCKEEIEPFVETVPPGFSELADAFWPGPMTLVLDILAEKIPNSVRAGLPTAAFRIPQHPIAQQLLKKSGPLVMPSANLSGTPSATTPEHVESDFGQEFPVLDGGACRMGLESTILIYQNERWHIIRQGALPGSAFKKVLGYIPKVKGNENPEKPLCPGQLFRHYAPQTKLILSKDCSVLEDQTILGFTDRHYPDSCRLISLGSLSNPDEVAENIYGILRFLDDEKQEVVYVDVDFPKRGILATIFERLNKAAAGC